MTYESFRRNLLGLNKSRHHKITNSRGVYDAYKYYRKIRPKDKKYKLTESQYFAIIRCMHKYMINDILNSREVKFPHSMGRLELRKKNAMIKLVNNKLVTNLPIDWDATTKLWYEDEEAFNNKTLIRIEEKELFVIYYSKFRANYNNNIFYTFHVNRELKQKVKELIKQNTIDAYQLWRTNS